MVGACGLGPYAFGRGGSSPPSGTLRMWGFDSPRLHFCPGGVVGSRARLKPVSSQEGEGSNPSLGTLLP